MTEAQRKMMELTGTQDKIYGQRVSELVRAKYSVDDELAIQRQRDEKAEAFAEYYEFVEDCKDQAYLEIYGENKG